jgi:molybdopterin converting factor small subunit
MAATIYIADTIRCVVKGLPKQVEIPEPEGKTIRQAALEVGVPPILIVFAVVDGIRRELDARLEDGDQVHFHGTVAGG